MKGTYLIGVLWMVLLAGCKESEKYYVKEVAFPAAATDANC